MRNGYLVEMFDRDRATSERIQAAFGGLDRAQLNWKPTPGSWSVGQCLHHLITADREYVPALEAIAAGDKVSTIWERLPLLPRVWGSLLRRAVHPDTRRRTKTFQGFEPATSDLPDTLVVDFARHAERMQALIASTDDVDHERVILTSPVSKFITYSLEDAVVILVTHHERHYRQGRAVLGHEGFPRD